VCSSPALFWTTYENSRRLFPMFSAKSKVLFGLDIRKLRPGDVILVRGHGISGWIVRRFTNSPYAHAELYAGQGMILESTDPFAYSKNVQREVFPSKDHVMVRRSVEDPTDMELDWIVAAARNLMGSRYSKIDAVSTVCGKIGGVVKKGRDAVCHFLVGDMFCSRLVAKSYEVADLDIVDHPDECKPSDLVSSNRLMTVADCLYELSDDEKRILVKPDAVGLQKRQFVRWFVPTRVLGAVFGSRIRTINDVGPFLLHHRWLDGMIVFLIKMTKYHKTYKMDLMANPERYSADALMAKITDFASLEQFIVNELAVVHPNLIMRIEDLKVARYNESMSGLKYCHLTKEILSGYIQQIGRSLEAYAEVVNCKGLNGQLSRVISSDISLIKQYAN